MGPEIVYPYPRLGPRQRAHRIPNDWPDIPGRSWGHLGQFAANPGDIFPPLIAAKNSSILAHFSRLDMGVKVDPIIGQP